MAIFAVSSNLIVGTHEFHPALCLNSSLIELMCCNTQGAASLCYVATRPELNGVSGKYFSDCTQIEPTVYGRSDELGKKVMQFCADFVKAKQPA